MGRARARIKPRRVYFEPGIVSLLVEHDGQRPPEALVRQLQELLRGGQPPMGDLPYADTSRRLGELLDVEKISPTRALSFTHLNREAVGRLELPRQRRPNAAAFALIAAPLRFSTAGRDLIRLVAAINREIARADWAIPMGEGVTLRAAAPNWLATPTPWVIGGGGPGSLPTPVRASDIAGMGGKAEAPFGITLEALAGASARRGEGPPVEVVILDTAPAERQVAAAMRRWGADHPLLRSLLEPGRLTRIYHDDPAWQIALPAPGAAHLQHHDYPMSDHGLFVAGVVHSVAPQAQLRLIEVLNEYGLGYVESIARVLGQLAKERAGKASAPLVINCSLMIEAPLAGHWAPDPAVEDDLEAATAIRAGQALAGRPAASLTPQEQGILAELDMLAVAIEWVFMAMREQQVLVVAAAGNDARPGARRPQARCPAAFATVVGVGALDRQGRSASYSNRADRQELQGLATFGGEVRPAPPRSRGRRARPAMPGQAVLGVYTGEFPQARPHRRNNANGWAWWAGTSFAAPIVSGALALMVGAGLAASLDDAHSRLIAAPEGDTPTGDEIIKAAQG